VTEGSYNVVFSRLAARALGERLPAAVAVAAIDFINGPLSDNQQRVGGPLHGELEGCRSARRGTYRTVYRIDQSTHSVFVLRIAHRRDVYST
jgi:mRNA interferase RelE/StbE